MNFQQIRASFFEVTDYQRLRKGGRPAAHNDYPADVRAAFVDHIDHLHRDGLITDHQARTITRK